MCQDIPRIPRAKDSGSLAGVITGNSKSSKKSNDLTQHKTSLAIAQKIQTAAVNGVLPPIKTINDLGEKKNWQRHY
jgi:hypothetical protein